MDTPPETTTDAPPRSGCSGVFISIFGVSLLICVGLWAWGEFGPSPETITMNGRVTISQRGNMFVSGTSCAGRGDFEELLGGNAITVRENNGSFEVVELRTGMLLASGQCVIRFTAEVEEADSYEFDVDGLPPLTVQKSLVDTVGDGGETELDVNLTWD